VKAGDGTILDEGTITAKRRLCEWAAKRTLPWEGATGATLFGGWIYDTLRLFAIEL